MKKLSITLLFLVQLHAAIAQNKTEDVTLTDMLKLKLLETSRYLKMENELLLR
jgi:hypothetical protein